MKTGVKSKPTATAKLPRPGFWRQHRRQINLVVLAIIMVAAVGPLILWTSNYLIVSDPLPEGTDAIIVLAGDDTGEREVEGARVYDQVLSKRIILSGGLVGWETAAADLMKKHLIFLGLPAAKIIAERQSTSTYENAIFSKKIMDRYHWRSAIVVTSAYHTRRTRMIFTKVFGADYRLYYHPAREAYLRDWAWWRNSRATEVVLMEYLKYWWYYLKFVILQD